MHKQYFNLNNIVTTLLREECSTEHAFRKIESSGVSDPVNHKPARVTIVSSLQNS